MYYLLRHVLSRFSLPLIASKEGFFFLARHCCSPAAAAASNMFSTVERGSPNSKEYRMYFKDEQGVISPFHDIPLRVSGKENTFNMVVEVPRWTNAKMEISTKEPMNPIKQDIKKDQLRFVHNCFPHHGYIWNYGAIPQTWENPEVVDENTWCKGDNDPIDVCEIGYRVAKRGDVLQVKVLGVMALIDEGETDWKVLAIDVNDPLASQLNDVDDIEKHMPGYLKATHEWFRIYKMPDGKPENKFAFGGEPKNKELALKVIEETHKHWKGLMNSTEENVLSRSNVAIVSSPHKIERDEAQKILKSSADPGDPNPLSPIVDKWHYVQLQKL